MNLNVIVGPILGSVIGYSTNYIAVKMLFRPLKPVKIGNHTLPFTPGVIPKGKPRLAKGLGKAVGETLLTEEDIKITLLKEDMVSEISESITKSLKESTISINGLFIRALSKEKYDSMKGNLIELITNKISNNIKEYDLGNIIANKGIDIIKEKLSGSFLSMMINDKLLNSFKEPIVTYVNSFINDNLDDVIKGYLTKEINNNFEKTPYTLLKEINIEEDTIKKCIENSNTDLVSKKVLTFVNKINISVIVEKKVNDMDVSEIEELVMSIMKKELSTVVNLGALIGFVIGLINIFI